MKIYGVGIIGLGIMGRTMLANMAEHDRFRVICGWDPSVESADSAKKQHPSINILQGPEAVITDQEVDLVYIAAPPLNHKEHTLWADKKSFRLSSGGRLQYSDGSDWTDEPIPQGEKDRKDAHRSLDAVVRVLEGDQGAMPGFAEGLAVQELVEGILDGGGIA